MAVQLSRPRVAFFIAAVLLLLVSILTVTLYSSILAFISNPVADRSQLINFDQQSYPVLQILPQNLNTASPKLALASGVISIVVSSACIIFAVLFWPDGNTTYPTPPPTNLIYALLLNASLSSLTTLYLQTAHLRSSAFDPSYRGVWGAYDKGTFDFEAWACQVGSYGNSFPRGACGDAVTGRVAGVLCCVGAVAVAGVGAWGLRGERVARIRARAGEREVKRGEVWQGDGDDLGDVLQMMY